MTEYIEEKIPILKLIAQTQWDYLTFSDAQKWLDINFKNDIPGKYYALKILLHLIYYKKKDITQLLEYGVFQKILGEDYKSSLISQNEPIKCKTDYLSDINALKSQCLFAPILDSSKPHESGNTIISDLVHHVDINKDNVDFHWKITADKLLHKKYLIFVDDCVGSGSQMRKFFKSEDIKHLIIQALQNGLKIYCLILIGYETNIEKLKIELSVHNINLVVCEVLTDRHRIFSEDNVIWEMKQNELNDALDYFKNLSKTRGPGYLGFKKLDFAIVLNNRMPNWTLPLFWKKSIDWEILIQRKSSL